MPLENSKLKLDTVVFSYRYTRCEAIDGMVYSKLNFVTLGFYQIPFCQKVVVCLIIVPRLFWNISVLFFESLIWHIPFLYFVRVFLYKENNTKRLSGYWNMVTWRSPIRHLNLYWRRYFCCLQSCPVEIETLNPMHRKDKRPYSMFNVRERTLALTLKEVRMWHGKCNISSKFPSLSSGHPSIPLFFQVDPWSQYLLYWLLY